LLSFLQGDGPEEFLTTDFQRVLKTAALGVGQQSTFVVIAINDQRTTRINRLGFDDDVALFEGHCSFFP
jgi:hypothetical protein